MRLLLFFLLLISSSIKAEEMPAYSGMHGKKMAVKYVKNSVGMSKLIAEELMGRKNGKAKFKKIKTIEFNLKNGEILNIPDFKCRETTGNKFVYAIISPKTAQKEKKFHPVRGWMVDEESNTLKSIHNPSEVDCVWSPEGEDAWPF